MIYNNDNANDKNGRNVHINKSNMNVNDVPTSLLQMLSSRAAAFSVKALLTAPGHQEAKEDEALREIKHEGEAPSPRDEEPSESPVEASSAQDEASAAPSPASPAAGEGGGDCAMQELPEGRTDEEGGDDGGAGDDEDDDDDLIVDVESNSREFGFSACRVVEMIHSY